MNNNNDDKIALSWGELLKRVSEKLGVDYNKIPKEGSGYPEIASYICKKYSSDSKIDYEQSLKKLKIEIAALTSWYPEHKQREKYSEYLGWLSPSWIITTNYDMVIESLLLGKSIPLEPNDSLSSPKSVIPVYHLHGLRTNPESIVITQEDYISLFRPNEYRQIKLALTIKESTTVLLGYGLGDVNVLTALDWSKNVFSSEKENYPNDIIQIIRSSSPEKSPYRDEHGVIIIETGDLSEFAEEFNNIRIIEEQKKEKERKILITLEKLLANPDKDTIDLFIDDDSFRKKILDTLSEFSINLISGFISFLDKCIDETWERSRPNGAFEGYNKNLTIILDILLAFPLTKFPPALFQAVVQSLERVGPYIGKNSGQSWDADRTWEKRKSQLSTEVVDELKNISAQHGYYFVTNLVKNL
nr:SIR2 family protein [Yersinia enterocolitica]